MRVGDGSAANDLGQIHRVLHDAERDTSLLASPLVVDRAEALRHQSLILESGQ